MDDQRGWRMTRTIHCPVCAKPTRHAMLRGDHCRDAAEEWDRRHAQRQQVSASRSADIVGDFRNRLLALMRDVQSKLRPEALTESDLLDLYEVYRRIEDRH